MEHHSNIVPWQLLCEAKGAQLRVLPVTDEGELRLEELEKLLTPRTKILALTHVSNALGTVNPIREIVALAHAHGVPVLVDGAQAVPHLKVDVQDLDCDFYCFGGHKMYGPTGIGVLYGRAALLEAMPPYQGGGDMISSVSFAKTYYNELPYKFEAGTPNIADVIGLGAAVDYLNQLGLDAIAAHEHQLLEHATAALADLPGVRIVGTAPHKAAVLSFVVTSPPLSALDVGTKLDLEGVAVRTGHHCCQPLMERYSVPGTVRATFGLYNTTQEVDIFAAALRRIVAEAAAKAKPAAPVTRSEVTFPKAAGPSPQAVADEVVELFEFLPDWNERYQHIIELGEKIPPLPAEFRTEANRVKGCQSTVFLQTRKRPGTTDVVEFLADSDADIVRGLIALLERVFSGQRAAQIVAFDVEGFFGRLGLNHHLSMGRRNGLAAMVQRVRNYAAEVTGKSVGR
jgi:cysteine desulfurase/selenocysteine lyase